MARQLRIPYAGAAYHVMNRGHRREEIFRDDPDRRRFLKTLPEACAKTGWQVDVCCLMNPARAKLLPAGAPLKSQVWSSFPEYLKNATRRPAWLRVDRLLGEHAIPKDRPAGRQMFEQRLEERRRAEDRSTQSAPGAASAAGDDDDAGVDGAALADGKRADAAIG